VLGPVMSRLPITRLGEVICDQLDKVGSSITDVLAHSHT